MQETTTILQAANIVNRIWEKKSENIFGSPLEVSEKKVVSQCSSFFRHCFTAAHGQEKFLELFKNKSPSAATIFNALKNNEKILVKNKPENGAVLSIKYDVNSAQGFTGHTALVVSYSEDTRIKHPNAYSYIVSVIDCTKTFHGALTDSRASAPGGVGAGYMRVLFDEKTGAVCGYSWSEEQFSPLFFNDLSGRNILLAKVD